MRKKNNFLMRVSLRLASILLGLIILVEPHSAVSAPQNTALQTLERKGCIGTRPVELLSKSFNFNDANAPSFPNEIAAEFYKSNPLSRESPENSFLNGNSFGRGAEGSILYIKLLRPSKTINVDEWESSSISGAAQTDERDAAGVPIRTVRVQMSVQSKNSDAIVALARLPTSKSFLSNQAWTIVPVVCSGSGDKVLGFASASITSVSVKGAWAYSLMFMLVFWLLLAFAAWQLNGKKLHDLWTRHCSQQGPHRTHSKFAMYIWKFREAVNPIFIAQDSLGFGSLARFQILVFTSVVGCVLIYVFIHSGVLSSISNTVLLLLGVTVAGGTFARFVGDWVGISAQSRRLLVGAEILRMQYDKPRWSDLFDTQGEIDVAKVQALLFTLLISASMFSNGYAGLSTFEVPEQIVYLSMISQGTYVFGKFLPADTRKRLEQDLEIMRDAARKLIEANNLSKNSDTLDQARTAFGQAKTAAATTLEQTYSDKFDKDRFYMITNEPRSVI